MTIFPFHNNDYVYSLGFENDDDQLRNMLSEGETQCSPFSDPSPRMKIGRLKLHWI